MWADIVFTAERFFLLRVLAWGALSVVIGTALLVATTVSAQLRGGLLRSFGAVCTVAGGIEVIAGGLWYSTLALRDLSAAARLERAAWFELGCWVGVAALGITLAVAGWRMARSARAAGGGMAITTHALALAVLQVQLIRIISR